jgi:large subunit ribosomal protein L24
MPARIRKGDIVAVMSGEDKGKRGRVLRVIPASGRVVVEGVNMVFKHLRKSQKNPQGGRIQREAPVRGCILMPVDPSTDKPTRVAYVQVDGKAARVARASRTQITGEASGRAEKPAKGGKAAKAAAKDTKE